MRPLNDGWDFPSLFLGFVIGVAGAILGVSIYLTFVRPL